VVTGMGPAKGSGMNKNDYYRECQRLSGVMAEKNEQLAAFYAENPIVPQGPFEEFDALHNELSKAIGDWQSFCDANRQNLTD
jgi:phage host-nuclease inhibitor protein Gam